MAIDFDKLMKDVKNNIQGDKKEKKDYSDDRFIKVTRDEKDNGTLILRFLPDKNGLGVVTQYKHWGKKTDAKGNSRFFIAECPTTIEKPCPYCEKYLSAWKVDDKELINSLKPGKRQEKYISNVLVVKDPGNKDNNGKVMLFEYGWKLSKIIEDTLNGDPDAEIDPINIYHPINGANFFVKQSPQGDYISYDGTKFLSPSSVVEDMDEFETLLEKTHDLSEFLDPSKFESYENLEKKLFKYENGYDLETSTKDSKKEETKVEKKKPETKKQEPVKVEKEPEPESSSVDEDDDDDFFNDL